MLAHLRNLLKSRVGGQECPRSALTPWGLETTHTER
jgi:hypothetical protein